MPQVRDSLNAAIEILGEKPAAFLVPKGTRNPGLPKRCRRLDLDPGKWPKLSRSLVWVVSPGSTRAQREILLREIYDRSEPGLRLAVAASDLEPKVLQDLLAVHFKTGKPKGRAALLGTRRQRIKRKALLLFPPIVAPLPVELFSIQPTALLRLSSHLKSKGVLVVFHNMFPLNDSGDLADLIFKEPARRYVEEKGLWPWGKVRCGNFENEKRTKPTYLLGEDFSGLKRACENWHFVQDVYISSVFTYHYQGTHQAVKVARELLPDARIHLGGIYPSLCPEHAEKSGADVVHAGPLDDINFQQLDFSLFERPPKFAVIKITRGCPFDCSFCAVHILEGNQVRVRQAGEVVEEIRHLSESYGVETFILWESNLLIKKGYFEKLLKRITSLGLKIRFMLPEGVMPALITDELAKWMAAAGLSEWIPLPLETADEDVLTRRFKKRNTLDQMVQATRHLQKYGTQVAWFILIGYAGQKLSDAVRSILFAWRTEAATKLLAFTPIPRTGEYQRAKDIIHDKDLSELAPECYPLAGPDFTMEEMENLTELFNMTLMRYEQLLRGDGCLLDGRGRLDRRYTLHDQRSPRERGILWECTAYLEMKKEYFLQESSKLTNPKTLVYYNVPARALFDGFSSVVIGRELSSEGFDFAGAQALAGWVRDRGKQLGIMLPRHAGDAWDRLVDQLAQDGTLRVIINHPDQARLKDLHPGLRLQPGRLLPEQPGLGLGDLGAWSRADSCGLFYPTAIEDPAGDSSPATVERLYDHRTGAARFVRGRAVHLLTPELSRFQRSEDIELLFEYSVPY